MASVSVSACRASSKKVPTDAPKGARVSVAQVAVQRGKRDVAPAPPEACTLGDELTTFEVAMTEAANATFSHRDGKHDDLVLATALALWGAKPRPQYAYSFNYIGRGRGDIPAYGNGVRPYGQRR